MNHPAIHDAAVLQRRAELLARPPAAPAAPDLRRVVAFGIAGQPCALELRWVHQVRPLRALAMLPFAQPHVRGICNVAGRMLAVVDVAPLLGLEAKEGKASLIVLGDGAPACGLVASHVDGLADVSLDRLDHHGAALFRGQRAGVIRGMTPGGVLLLDGEAIAALCARAEGDTFTTSQGGDPHETTLP